MSERLKALREKRAKIVADMRAIKDAADAAKRDVTDEERQKCDEMFAAQGKLGKDIEDEEKLIEAERSLAQIQAENERSRAKGGDTSKDAVETRKMAAFRKFLASGERSLNEQELRDLTAGSPTEGGFLRSPQAFVMEIIKAIDDAVFIRGLARKFMITGPESLGVPVLDTDVSDADWTTELQTGNKDTSLKVAKRELRPNPVAKLIKVSKKLMRSSAFPVEQLVRERLAYKFGVTLEKAYLTGDGDKKPLGLFVASSEGITTARDVATGNTTTAVTYNNAIAVKFKLKQAYWSKARWLMHRDVVKAFSLLTDEHGQYIWRESLRGGEPDTLLGLPITMSEFAPSTLTTSAYIGMLGDFSHYWIADALDLQIQALRELFAVDNQDGFIGRMETDGAPILEEAFVRMQMAAG